MEKTNKKVKIQEKMSSSSETTAGLRQDTFLFNLYKKKFTANVKTNPRGAIFNGTKLWGSFGTSKNVTP